MGLTATLLQIVPSEEGRQGDVLITEPNGDRHCARCLCRPQGPIELGEEGDGSNLDYLIRRYGPDHVYGVASAAVLESQAE